MAAVVEGPGPIEWKMDRDEVSHRTYDVTFRVRGLVTDGPAQALQAVGLPKYGDLYAIGTDLDIWAFCRWPLHIVQEVVNEPNIFYKVTLRFSTKPDKALCLLDQEQNPLLIPPKISGQTVNYTEEAWQDRFGNPLVNSAWERFTGPQVEFDANRHRIHIEMNVVSLEMPFICAFLNKVNSVPIWGVQARCVKLSQFNWDRLFYGNCFPYFTWKFDFDIRMDSFDRFLLDEGTKVLNGHWDHPTGNWVLDPVGGLPPNPANPSHFIRYPDRQTGNPTRVILDGFGLPADVFLGTGTGQGHSCDACSTTPASVSLVYEGSEDGTAFFLGPYANYMAFGSATLTSTDGCTFTATDGTETVSVFFSYNGTTGRKYITISFTSTDPSVPSAFYTYNVKGTFPYNCSSAFLTTISDGDPTQCPASIEIEGTGSQTGPPFTGNPGVRIIQKYDEIDFALLGVPLIF